MTVVLQRAVTFFFFSLPVTVHVSVGLCFVRLYFFRSTLRGNCALAQVPACVLIGPSYMYMHI